MSGRISRVQMYMQMAHIAARRSTCSRLNVGSIITFHDSPVSIGWNGAVSGAEHCTGNLCAGMTPGACPAIHAENNAMKKAVELLPYGSLVDLYSTHSPCKACMYQMMRCEIKVKRLFFGLAYRESEHLEKIAVPYWSNAKIEETERRTTEVYEVTPAGYIVNYFSRRFVELV